MKTVLRKAYIDKIWGDDSFLTPVILMYISTKLRDYLKEDEKIQIITLGVGYRLVDWTTEKNYGSWLNGVFILFSYFQNFK